MPTDIAIQSDGDIALSESTGDLEQVSGNEHVLQRIAVRTASYGPYSIGPLTDRSMQQLKADILETLRSEPFVDPPYSVRIRPDTDGDTDKAVVSVVAASDAYEFTV